MSSTPLFIRYRGGGDWGKPKGAQGATGSEGNAGGAGFFIWLNLWDTTDITPTNPLTSSYPYLAQTIPNISGTTPAFIVLPNSSINNSLTFQFTSQNTFKLGGGGQWILTLYGSANISGVFFRVTDITKINITSSESILGVYSEVTELSTISQSINIVNGNISNTQNFWQINQGDTIQITFTFYGNSDASSPPLASILSLYFQDSLAYSNFIISAEVLIKGPTGTQGVAGNPNVGATIVDSAITLNSNIYPQTNKLDVVSGDYYNTGDNNFSVNISNIEK